MARECRHSASFEDRVRYATGDMSHQCRYDFENHLQGCDSCERKAFNLIGILTLLSAAYRLNPKIFQIEARKLAQWHSIKSIAYASALIALLVMSLFSAIALRSSYELKEFLETESTERGSSPLSPAASNIMGLDQASIGHHDTQKQAPKGYDANFHTGACYLIGADKILWVDRTKIDLAVKYLQKAQVAAIDMREPIKQAQAHFYLGRAYLLKKDNRKAKENFSRVLELGNETMKVISLKNQATELMKRM